MTHRDVGDPRATYETGAAAGAAAPESDLRSRYERSIESAV